MLRKTRNKMVWKIEKWGLYKYIRQINTVRPRSIGGKISKRRSRLEEDEKFLVLEQGLEIERGNK